MTRTNALRRIYNRLARALIEVEATDAGFKGYWFGARYVAKGAPRPLAKSALFARADYL